MSSSIQISIVIPTCNRLSELLQCISHINKQVFNDSVRIEIIVTDDGSLDNHAMSEITLRAGLLPIQIISGPKRGPAANRNFGASKSSAEWLVFVDDDCIPDPKWVQGYLDAMNEFPDKSVFEGRVYAPSPKPSLEYISPTNQNGGYLWSCNFAIRRDLFSSLKGFDERFPHAAMEDVDLRYRLKSNHIDFRFVPTASVCHPWRKRGGWRSLKKQRDSILIYLDVHPEERSTITPLTMLYTAIRGLLKQTLPEIFKGRLRGVISALTEHLSYVVLALRLLLKR